MSKKNKKVDFIIDEIDYYIDAVLVTADACDSNNPIFKMCGCPEPTPNGADINQLRWFGSEFERLKKLRDIGQDVSNELKSLWREACYLMSKVQNTD